MLFSSKKFRKSSIRCKPSFLMLISYCFLKRGSLRSLWHVLAAASPPLAISNMSAIVTSSNCAGSCRFIEALQYRETNCRTVKFHRTRSLSFYPFEPGDVVGDRIVPELVPFRFDPAD